MLGLGPVVHCGKRPTQPIAIGRWRSRCLTDTCGFRRKGACASAMQCGRFVDPIVLEDACELAPEARGIDGCG